MDRLLLILPIIRFFIFYHYFLSKIGAGKLSILGYYYKYLSYIIVGFDYVVYTLLSN